MIRNVRKERRRRGEERDWMKDEREVGTEQRWWRGEEGGGERRGGGWREEERRKTRFEEGEKNEDRKEG